MHRHGRSPVWGWLTAFLYFSAGVLEQTFVQKCDKYAMGDFIFNRNGIAFAVAKSMPYLENMSKT